MPGNSAAVSAGVSRSNGAPAAVHPPRRRGPPGRHRRRRARRARSARAVGAGLRVERAPQRDPARRRADVAQVLRLAELAVAEPQQPRAVARAAARVRPARTARRRVTSQPRAASASAAAAPNTPAPTTIALDAAGSQRVARVVARREVPVAVGHERRLGRRAHLGRVAAAGVEAAARPAARPGSARRPAARSARAARRRGPGPAPRRAAPPCTGGPGAAQTLLGRPDLDDLAEVHDGDAVGDLAHDREVVGDEHVGRPELLLEVLEQVDDLRLDRHVERRDRLVGDDELRAQRERAGDPDPLALAAGELVRVAARVLGRQPDELRAARAPAPGSRCAGAPCGSASAARCSPRSACAGSATRTGPGRPSACRAAPGASRRARAWRCRARRTRPCPRSGRSAGAGRARASTCRSPTRRRGRASRPRGPRGRRRRPPAPRRSRAAAARASGRGSACARRWRGAGPRSCRVLRRRRGAASAGARPRPAGGRRRGGPGRCAARARGRSSQRAKRCGQRAAKTHPVARSVTTGGAPGIAVSRRGRGRSSRGIDPSRLHVYGCCGSRNTSRVGPCSITRPAYITSTRSAIPATTPMSCVISTTDDRVRVRSSRDQLEDLRLDRDVERGRRLVRDQHPRVAGERHRDHHPLAHAARELVRIVVHAPLRLGDADRAQQLDRRARAPPRRRAARARGSARRAASRPCRPG